MKKILFLLSAVLLTFSVGAQDLPTTTIKQLNGRPVKFNKIFKEGRVTLVSFWATWCVPCKAEIKNIKDILPEWRKQAEFDFITISIDDSRAAARVKAYSISQGWDWPVYLDPNSNLKRSLNFQDVPFTMIVDGNGKVVYQHTGYESGGEHEVFEQVKKYANGNKTITKPAVKETLEEAIKSAVQEEASEAVKGAKTAVEGGKSAEDKKPDTDTVVEDATK